MTTAISIQFQSHFVAELAVEVRDAGDCLKHVPTVRAPLMDDIELCADESPPSVAWVCRNELRPTDRDLYAGV